jgi:hypothetical protein
MVADPQRVPFSERDIRKFITEQVDGQPNVHLPTVANRATDFLLQNPDLTRAFCLARAREMVYDIAAGYVARTRGVIQYADAVVDQAQFIAQASLKWASWLERAEGRHVRILGMTKQELENAAATRMLRAERDLVLARTWREMAKHLDDVQVAGDVFDAEDIEHLLQEIQQQPLTLTRTERSWATRLARRRGPAETR